MRGTETLIRAGWQTNSSMKLTRNRRFSVFTSTRVKVLKRVKLLIYGELRWVMETRCCFVEVASRITMFDRKGRGSSGSQWIGGAGARTVEALVLLVNKSRSVCLSRTTMPITKIARIFRNTGTNRSRRRRKIVWSGGSRCRGAPECVS